MRERMRFAPYGYSRSRLADTVVLRGLHCSAIIVYRCALNLLTLSVGGALGHSRLGGGRQ
jgi:hypothetical protein